VVVVWGVPRHVVACWLSVPSDENSSDGGATSQQQGKDSHVAGNSECRAKRDAEGDGVRSWETVALTRRVAHRGVRARESANGATNAKDAYVGAPGGGSARDASPDRRSPPIRRRGNRQPT